MSLHRRPVGRKNRWQTDLQRNATNTSTTRRRSSDEQITAQLQQLLRRNAPKAMSDLIQEYLMSLDTPRFELDHFTEEEYTSPLSYTWSLLSPCVTATTPHDFTCLLQKNESINKWKHVVQEVVKRYRNIDPQKRSSTLNLLPADRIPILWRTIDQYIQIDQMFADIEKCRYDDKNKNTCIHNVLQTYFQDEMRIFQTNP